MNEMDSLIKNFIFDIQILKEKVSKLEQYSHPKKNFVRCKQCEERITESSKLMQAAGDEAI